MNIDGVIVEFKERLDDGCFLSAARKKMNGAKAKPKMFVIVKKGSWVYFFPGKLYILKYVIALALFYSRIFESYLLVNMLQKNSKKTIQSVLNRYTVHF